VFSTAFENQTLTTHPCFYYVKPSPLFRGDFLFFKKNFTLSIRSWKGNQYLRLAGCLERNPCFPPLIRGAREARGCKQLIQKPKEIPPKKFLPGAGS